MEMGTTGVIGRVLGMLRSLNPLVLGFPAELWPSLFDFVDEAPLPGRESRSDVWILGASIVWSPFRCASSLLSCRWQRLSSPG